MKRFNESQYKSLDWRTNQILKKKIVRIVMYNKCMTFSNKSCELDPLPTWLLKQCTEEFLPLISAIINNSLESGIFPSQCKHAIIKPLLKKQGLDADDLKNYSLVSNLQFISKVLEKVADQRIGEHLNTHSLNDPLQ